jgi:hypothetical protein
LTGKETTAEIVSKVQKSSIHVGKVLVELLILNWVLRCFFVTHYSTFDFFLSMKSR